MDEDKLRQQLIQAIEDNPKLWEQVLKLDSGAGTYTEVNDIAAYLGDKIAEGLVDSYSPELLAEYMVAGHDIVSMLAEAAQKNLNDAAGIGLAPMKTKPPNARISAMATELGAIAPEKLADELANTIPPEILAMVDAIVKYNADFQAKAGLKPIIVRTWSGSYPSHDTKHTDWCKNLAGKYAYGSEPKNVYARHKGCRCKVEYFPSEKAQGRITALAKGQVDINGVLWNTRADTLEKRLKRAARSK